MPAQFVPGRREYTLDLQVRLVDHTFIQYALRDTTADIGTEPPYAPGQTYRGMRYLTLEGGVDAALGGTQVFQYPDCLFNSLGLDYDEGQIVQARCELWPICRVAVSAAAASGNPSDPPEVYTWAGMDCSKSMGNFRQRVQRVGLRVTNALTRNGCRAPLRSGGTEIGLSRTARNVVPGPQAVEVSLHLNAWDAAEWRDWSWGTISVTATKQSGASFEAQIDLAHLVDIAKPQVAPGSIVTVQANTTGQVISIT